MSGGEGERSLDAWRADAHQVLSRCARAHGIDGLRRVNALKALLNVYDKSGGEPLTPAAGDPPAGEELAALHKEAARLASEYLRVKRRAEARDSAPDLAPPADLPGGTERPPEPPKPAPVAPTPVPYGLSQLVDPLFAREMVNTPRLLNPRDLRSPDAVARIRARQEAALASFFAAPSPASGTAPEARAWTAHLELDDGLFVVTSALVGLPRFVKTLELVAGQRRIPVLGANLRSGVCRTRVRPSVAPYTWSAGEFDDELGEELKALTLPGLTGVRATAFRVDTAGTGQRLTGEELSPGRAYRLLVPPGVRLEGFATADITAPEEGWQVVSLSLPAPVPPELARRLLGLGFAVTKAGLDVDFTGIAARQYRSGRSGERYPCFSTEDTPMVRITGVEAAGAGEVVLFLVGPAGQAQFALPPGKEHLVQLGPLAPGRYALDVLATDPSLTPERLLFEVDAQAGRAPEAASAAVEISGERLAIDGAMSLERDLGALDEAALRITAPPLWRIGARWEGERSRPLSPLFADVQGQVGVGALLAATQVARQTERVGDLCLDFGDLGALTLRHTHLPSVEEVRERLRALWAERAAAVEAEADASLLLSIWLTPVCAALGYRLSALPGEAESLGAGAVRLCCALSTTVREGERITTERPAALLLLPRGVDLRGAAPGGPRDLAAKLGRRDGYARVLLTDGLIWALWERGRSFSPAPIDLRLAFGGDGSGVDDLVERFHA